MKRPECAAMAGVLAPDEREGQPHAGYLGAGECSARSSSSALASGGDSPETLYAGSMRSGILKSTDGGRTWNQVSGELSSLPGAALEVDPFSPQTVYAGVQGGLYKSTDGGASWEKLPYPGEKAVAVSPARPDVVLAIEPTDRGGLVYRSEDGGKTWGESQ